MGQLHLLASGSHPAGQEGKERDCTLAAERRERERRESRLEDTMVEEIGG